MVELTAINGLFCYFMFNCFKIDIEHAKLTKITAKNEPSKLPQIFQCPDFCACYSAPEDNFKEGIGSYSIYCQTDPKQQLSKRVSGDRISVNTVVFDGTEPVESDWLLKYVSPKSLVYLGSSPEKLTVVPEKHNPKYITVVGAKQLDFNLFSNFEKIYISDCTLMDRTYTYVHTMNPNLMFENVLYIDKNFPLLRSLTVRRSGIEMIANVLDSKNGPVRAFFPFSPELQIIDFSFNSLMSIDPIVESHHPKVTEIYLDHNNIQVLPRQMKDSFPNLRILHLHHNFITFLSPDFVVPLLGIDEFWMFSSDPTKAKIYCTKDMISWLQNIPQAHGKSMVVMDSFIKSVMYECHKDPSTNSPLKSWEEVVSANTIRHSESHCMPWDEHPYRIYTKRSSENFLNDGYMFTFSGSTVKIKEAFFMEKDIHPPHEVIRLVIDDLTHEETSHILLQNLKRKMLSSSQYFIISVQNHDNLLATDWFVSIFYGIPRIVGFSPVLIDTQWANFKLDFKDSNVCPMNIEDFEILSGKVLTPYQRFFTKTIKDLEKHIQILRIDFECLPLLQLILNDQLIHMCMDQFSSKSMQLSSNDHIRIDAIDIVLKVPTVKSYKEQSEVLQQYKSENLFEGRPLIITFRDGRNHLELEESEEMFRHITQNFMSD